MKPYHLLPLALILKSTASAETRTWTDISGRKLQAEMTGMDAATRSIKLRLQDGRDFAIPISSLSTEDVAYAAALWRQMQASGSAPATAAIPGATGSLNTKLLPPRFVARCSPTTRLEQIKKHGGDPKVEMAVQQALTWLKGNQNKDGSWGAGNSSNKSGYTGFVLQCFTGHGEGPDSAAFGDTVRKACENLIRIAATNPHGMLTTEVKSATSTYAHAIAATALGESYILAKAGSQMPPNLEATFIKAAMLIINSQNKRGSWTYGGTEAGQPTSYNPGSSGEDLSLANWQLQALLVAKESGIKLTGLETCIKQAMNYLESKQTKDGGFGAMKSDLHYNQWHMSGGAILGLQMLGSTAKAGKGIRFLREELTKDPPDWQKNFNLYSWASNTSAFFNAGGDDWAFYLNSVIPQILAAQSPDGSFQKGVASWPASNAAEANYRQALCTLQLEVFYRFSK